MSLFATLRRACADVARDARFVRIDAERLAAFTRALLADPVGQGPDPAHHRRATPEETLAFVLSLDAINFGSGWFPHLRKREGRSGYFTIALSLADRFDAKGAWAAAELAELESGDLARVLGQEPSGPEVAELVELYARALRDLGRHLLDHHAGRFAGPVEQAGGSAEALVAELARMPLYRDVSVWHGREVPFFKRAQITALDLHAAFDGCGPGAFHDLDALTLFADNLVPHVLRMAGVLVYAPELAAPIDAGALVAPGSPEEIELRACALHAVEEMVGAARALGQPQRAWQLDERLWWRGQRPEIKARPRHRTRTVFY